MSTLLYADNNATTSVAPEVAQAMRPFFGADFFNPSSMYDPAAAVARALAEARAAVAGRRKPGRVRARYGTRRRR